MKKIVVVYHSGFGHTQRMAQAVAEGAGAELLAIDPDGHLPADGWDLLKEADAIIFGSPTHMGGASWQFKKFADDSSSPWIVQAWKDKLAAGFTSSSGLNGDSQLTLHYFFTLAMQHSMVWVSQGLLPANKKSATRNDVNSLASFAGVVSQTPSDASAGQMQRGDLETARLLGERVADWAAKIA